MSRGRPSKLTPKAQRIIVKAIAQGNTRETAAALAGIDRSTLFLWMVRGQKASSGPYFDLFTQIKKAEAAAIAVSVSVIRRAARETWTAAAWWLERRYPDEWGRKDRVELERVIRREAERIADETGLDADEIVAAAEAIARSG